MSQRMTQTQTGMMKRIDDGDRMYSHNGNLFWVSDGGPVELDELLDLDLRKLVSVRKLMVDKPEGIMT